MTAASYSQQSSLDKNRGTQKAPSWEASSMSTGCDSWSDDSTNKIKKRSHRPRGCRGGGSRRARKERRELQFLAHTQQLQQTLPAIGQTCSTGIPSNELHSGVSFQEPELPVLPYLQFSSSFSSSGSDASDISHGLVNSKASGYDILPSMPTTQRSTTSSLEHGGNNYRDMTPLPPLPSVHTAASFSSLVKGQTLQTSYNDRFHTQGAPTTAHDCAPMTTFSNNQTVSSVSTSLELLPFMFTDIIATGSSYYHPDNIHNLILDDDFHRGYNTTERIKKQQDMLAGGGSLFATSPKSFLLGKKKEPVFCF